MQLDQRPISQTEPNPGRLSSSANHDAATIFTRSEDVFPPHGVLHELLHIRRYWIEAVPQVMPTRGDEDSSERWRITSQIENALEHLVIVPMEADFGSDPYPYWNETVKKNWSRYPWPEIQDPWARRAICLVGSLSARFLVNETRVRDLAESCIAKEGLLVEARRFHEKIARVLNSKPAAVSAVLRFLRIPFEEVALVAFDVRQRKRVPIPLAQH